MVGCTSSVDCSGVRGRCPSESSISWGLPIFVGCSMPMDRAFALLKTGRMRALRFGLCEVSGEITSGEGTDVAPSPCISGPDSV